MPSDFSLPAGAAALIFPGQGAQHPEMLEPFRGAAGFGALFGQVCELLGFDPLERAGGEPEVLNRNDVSSLLTVLASALGLRLLQEANPGLAPVGVAGYSVGQWAALHAAGSLSAPALLDLVHRRAQLMDACVAEAAPSGMLAVIGLKAADIDSVCQAVADAGAWLLLTNDNAPGQVTLGGGEAGLALAQELLAGLRPKKVQRVPVAGAWHSPILEGAVPGLAALIREADLKTPALPVIDNTTGGWLPAEPPRRDAALARQVAAPVLWRQGLATLGAQGVEQLVEVGYGDLLTRFGFFNLRSCRHHALIRPPRPRP